MENKVLARVKIIFNAVALNFSALDKISNFSTLGGRPRLEEEPFFFPFGSVVLNLCLL